MSEPIVRVAIAGYGRSGCNIHARWLREAPEQYRIVAVADQLPERRADAERDFGCATYADYHGLLARTDVDLFINALPSFFHTRGTLEAFGQGLNVVCEKPIALSVADFDRMTAAAAATGKLFAPFQNSRFYPYFQKMREIIASGVLGEILHIRSVWSGFARRWDWQTLQENGGGNLNNTGPHPLDQAIVLFGERQPQVFCRMKSIQPFGGDADDWTAVTLYGDDAPVIEILVSSYLAYPLGEQYNISGTYGGLTGGPRGLNWRYFDPDKAPRHDFWRPWSQDRKYCSEELPWVEERWEPAQDLNDLQHNSRAFYDNLYAALVRGAELVVKPEQVRRQIAVLEECHRQNPLPRRESRGDSGGKV
jgi:scyllo-inositol 2-dehydrogenase (NADP+)